MNALHDVLPLLCKQARIRLKDVHIKKVSGGSINEVYHISNGNGQEFCCKLNSATKFPHLFELEAKGLQLLSASVATPDVLGHIETDTTQALLLQWITPGLQTPLFWEKFGAALARLHHTEGPSFGLSFNNYMGSVPQANEPLHAWPLFFGKRRLLPLTKLCFDQHLLDKNDKDAVEWLTSRLADYFEPTTPRLIHGDLWSGNFLCNQLGLPLLIDPAPYYGHPSADLGMTTLFGGFDPLFYKAYHHYAPFPDGYRLQWAICNLYPLLIHLLLFGKSYLSRIRQILIDCKCR